MTHDVQNHLDEYTKLLKSFFVSDRKGNPVHYTRGVDKTIEAIQRCRENNKKVMFVGNGGSAALVNHFALDYWHAAGVRSVSFLDGPQLTCLANDHGYEKVFSMSVEMFGDEDDLLVAVSSSGKSRNILNAVEAARKKNNTVITFSGFSPDNPLCQAGDLNFHVPSEKYGFVETAHEYILHAVLDVLVERQKALTAGPQRVTGMTV